MNAALYILNDNQDIESPTCILWASLCATSNCIKSTNVLKYLFNFIFDSTSAHDLSPYLVAQNINYNLSSSLRSYQFYRKLITKLKTPHFQKIIQLIIQDRTVPLVFQLVLAKSTRALVHQYKYSCYTHNSTACFWHYKMHYIQLKAHIFTLYYLKHSCMCKDHCKYFL